MCDFARFWFVLDYGRQHVAYVSNNNHLNGCWLEVEVAALTDCMFLQLEPVPQTIKLCTEPDSFGPYSHVFLFDNDDGDDVHDDDDDHDDDDNHDDDYVDDDNIYESVHVHVYMYMYLLLCLCVGNFFLMLRTLT
uniref:Uncharacterized protein n=1 Tax=Glossina pallidipes TaxID=7398 RepID=A0A1A9ZE89_GLOPL